MPQKRSYKYMRDKEMPILQKDTPPKGTTFQLMVGVAEYDDLTFQATNPTYPGTVAETEIDSMPFMGIAAQAPMVGEEVQFGLEGGFTMGAWGDRDKTYVSNNVLAVDLDSYLYLADLYGGAFAAVDLSDKVRLYAGAGPLLMYGYYEYEIKRPGSSATNDKISDDEAALGLGLYTRAGVDFRIGKFTQLGFTARAIKADLDFGGDIDDVDVDGVQLMLTWGVWF